MKDKNSGYIGNKMSKNAHKAHQDGQFPISNINAKLLRGYKFNYSVAFFKWLCKKGYVKAISNHHTGAASVITRFYSATTITYIVDKCNLPLLYDMYRGKANKDDAKKHLGIKFVKIKIPMSLLNIKSFAAITIDAVFYKEYFFISKEKWLHPNKNQIQIVKEWDHEPSNGDWKNNNKDAIVRKIILFKSIDDIIKKNFTIS